MTAPGCCGWPSWSPSRWWSPGRSRWHRGSGPSSSPTPTSPPSRRASTSSRASPKFPSGSAATTIAGRPSATAWTDDNPAPGGHNGCDTRNDILDRDLVDKTYRVDQAVSQRGCHRHAARPVHQRHHGVHPRQSGRRVRCRSTTSSRWRWPGTSAPGTGPTTCGVRFANDPANLLAVDGQANQDKGDAEPADWMPPNHAFWCQYAVQFAAVLRGYALPIDDAVGGGAARRGGNLPDSPRCRCRSPGPAGSGCRRRAR